jgi:hypothetical protein
VHIDNYTSFTSGNCLSTAEYSRTRKCDTFDQTLSRTCIKGARHMKLGGRQADKHNKKGKGRGKAC